MSKSDYHCWANSLTSLSPVNISVTNVIRAKTISFIKANGLYSEFSNYHNAMHLVFNLIPQTSENLFSGSMFPFFECEYEANTSSFLAELGLYKQAMISLRSALELGILSVYWDIDDKAHIEIQDWLHSRTDTPFNNQIKKKILTNNNVVIFDRKHLLLDSVYKLFSELSNFTHSKGAKYSSNKFSYAIGNIMFQENNLLFWIENYKTVVKYVVLVHLLKYPVAVIPLPLYDKFGIDPPSASFLSNDSVEIIKKLFNDDEWLTLENISRNDPTANGIREWFNSLPDMSKKEHNKQELEQNKWMIKHYRGGFNKWKSDRIKLIKKWYSEDSRKFKTAIQKINVLEKWAKSSEHINSRNKVSIKKHER